MVKIDNLHSKKNPYLNNNPQRIPIIAARLMENKQGNTLQE
jgi:hypothetical protein